MIPAEFSRHFRRFYGRSSQEYRRQQNTMCTKCVYCDLGSLGARPSPQKHSRTEQKKEQGSRVEPFPEGEVPQDRASQRVRNPKRPRQMSFCQKNKTALQAAPVSGITVTSSHTTTRSRVTGFLLIPGIRYPWRAEAQKEIIPIPRPSAEERPSISWSLLDPPPSFREKFAISPHLKERRRVGMPVEDKLEVATGNRSTAVADLGC